MAGHNLSRPPLAGSARRRRRQVATAAAIALLGLLLAGVVSAQSAGASPDARRERRIERLADSWRDGPFTAGEAAATASMVLALLTVAFCTTGWGGGGATPTADGSGRAWLLAGAAVLAWSAVVRFGLTQANILTDGGSGYTRLMRYVEGYGGVAVLVHLLPPAWSAFMWQAMLVPRLLALLAPALLVWLARELDLTLGAALLAGVMLAALPAHAVLTSSDHLEGVLSSLQLAAVACVLAAGRTRRVDLYAAGLALAAWAMWCRPEGALGLLPVAVAALRLPRRWWARPAVWTVTAALLVAVGFRAYAIVTSPTAGLGSSSVPPFDALGWVPWGDLAWSPLLIPPWLWAPAPFAVWTLYRRRALPVVLAGLAAALVPVYLRGLFPDPAGTHLETVRYGIPAFGWLALMAGVALDRALARLPARAIGRWPAYAALVLALAAVPVGAREYLARRYGHVASESAIRDLLRQVPAGCGVAVPDDGPERVSIEIADRYRYIAAEAAAAGDLPELRIVPASHLLDAAGAPAGCWTYLRGPYCYHGFDGHPAIACRGIEERFALRPIASRSIEFRHHRLVTGPAVTRAPWYMASMPITLYEITGPAAPPAG
ncbi:hypothetical protein KF840_06695 [bacterium]|nr:hypothetical protein [bacterium]